MAATIQQSLDTALKHYHAGRVPEAVAALKQAAALQGDVPEAHFQLGQALQAIGQVDEAIGAYRQALALRPSYAEAMNSLGTAFAAKGEADQAITAFRQALTVNPSYETAHYNLAATLQKKGRLDEAIAEYRLAIAAQPAFVQAYSNLGDALKEKGEFDEAISACNAALARRPGNAEALTVLGQVLNEKGQWQDAIAMYRRALTIQPQYPEAHWSLGLLQLSRGNFVEGWKDYEWRWRCRELRLPMLVSSRPRWDGSPLNGRRMFLNVEQGLGDMIQFIRYAPMLVERGGRIVVDCMPALKRLFQSAEGIETLAVRGEPLPEFDTHYPLLSLPLAFGTTLETIPARTPYLHADSDDAARWRQRFDPADHRLRVGLVWGGNPNHRNERTRSMALNAFAALASVPNVRFHSLQKGPAADQAASPPAGLELIDWTAELNDFADTAALMLNLDLVITVDTSVAHLAGALARSVWVLLPTTPDFRWMHDRDDSPWYPTMRLFRQTRWGAWDEPMERVRAELTRAATERK